MPISRGQAQQAVASEDADPYRRLCERFDRVALEAERTSRPQTYAANLVEPRHLIDRLIDDYRGKGWDVRLVLDQRDGDYIEIK